MKSNFIFKGKLSGKFLIAIMPAFLLIFLLLSCKDELNTIQTTNKTNLVSLEKAIEVAQAQSGSSKSVKGAKESAEISSSLAVNPNGGDPTFYILNYKKGGFAIISADDRTVPVLAYSEKGSFPLNQKFYPSGLIDWLASTNDGIEALRQENKPQTESQKDIWRQYSSDNYMQAQAASNEGPDACTYQGQTSISIETKNLNTARWAQTGSGYNDNIAMSCPSNSGGKAPVGCVANAVGIIMKYYQYPSQYNWSSMFDNAGSSETARLLADLGTSSNLDNSYGCDGSSASMNRVVPTLADHGYYNASLSNYSYTTVHNEIYNNRPVILSGGKRSNWWVFYYYDDGHAWVADGYRDTHYYECRQNPYNPSQWEKVRTTTTTQFWMNWGWGGMHNGWYMNNNFNPGGYTFNYTPKMVTNIHP